MVVDPAQVGLWRSNKRRRRANVYLVGFVALMAFLVLDHPVRHRADVRRTAAIQEKPPGVGAVDGADRPVSVDVGGILVGTAHPIVVQSMTNTDTADADATAMQVAALAHAGSQLVRVTVNNEAAAAAVPEIVAQGPRPRRGRADHRRLPLQRPQLLIEVPGDGAALAKYRINPGNVGTKRHERTS